MDHEELDQIPWSTLVAEVDDGPDRRWFFLAGAVGLALLGYLIAQFVGSGGQPDPVAQAVPPVSSTSTTTARPEVIIAEDDLRAETPAFDAGASARHLAAIARAEWFVTDWFTSDGSQATADSLLDAVVSPTITRPPVPEEMVTYVEWARATGFEATEDGLAVTVAYRQIVSEDASPFVRKPVAIVAVHVTFDGGVPLISGAPEPSNNPWTGAG